MDLTVYCEELHCERSEASCDEATSSAVLTAQIWRIMKLVTVLILTACLTASATGEAQLITISQKNAPLAKVFSEIEKQTTYSFVYTDQLLLTAKNVNVEVNGASLEQVLAICFKDQPYTYTISDKFIVIKTKEPVIADVIVSTAKQPALIDIKGRITNTDNEPVIASIIVKGTQQGTTSNADGYFELKGVDENATLLISGISIENLEIKVSGRKEFNFSAKIKVTSLNEVIINKGYYTEKKQPLLAM